jgi:putative transposase
MEGNVLVKKLLSADNRRGSYSDNSQVYRKSRQVMIVNKAYRYRLYPTREQKMMFAKTFGCVRFIYNKMLSDRIDYYKETGQKLNNTPAQYKEEFPWLKEVDSLALANAQMNLNKAYITFGMIASISASRASSPRRIVVLRIPRTTRKALSESRAIR